MKKPAESKSNSSEILVWSGAQYVTTGVTVTLRTVLSWTALGMDQNKNIQLKQIKVMRKYLSALFKQTDHFMLAF